MSLLMREGVSLSENFFSGHVGLNTEGAMLIEQES